MPHTKMFSRFIIYSDAEFNRKKISIMPPASGKMPPKLHFIEKYGYIFDINLCCLRSLVVFRAVL